MKRGTSKTFTERVLTVVAKIPKGETLTYGEVARRAGSPRAYRAVGNILNSYDSSKIRVPCHRVVLARGASGGYRWGAAKKRALLQEEGALV